MSTPDRNLHSFNGPHDNGRRIDDGLNYGYGETAPWADTLKFTDQLQDVELIARSVKGGDEDCADFNNRCSNIRLYATKFVPLGKYVSTVKGGCTGIDIRGEILIRAGTVEHDFGNDSDQSDKKTTGNIVGTWIPGGLPVRIRILHADKPMLVPGTGPYVYAFPHPDAWYHGPVVLCLRAWWKISKLFGF